jgi:hypothetical protein
MMHYVLIALNNNRIWAIDKFLLEVYLTPINIHLPILVWRWCTYKSKGQQSCNHNRSNINTNMNKNYLGKCPWRSSSREKSKSFTFLISCLVLIKKDLLRKYTNLLLKPWGIFKMHYSNCKMANSHAWIKTSFFLIDLPKPTLLNLKIASLKASLTL